MAAPTHDHPVEPARRFPASRRRLVPGPRTFDFGGCDRRAGRSSQTERDRRLDTPDHTCPNDGALEWLTSRQIGISRSRRPGGSRSRAIVLRRGRTAPKDFSDRSAARVARVIAEILRRWHSWPGTRPRKAENFWLA